jgi:hypothetical protein
MPMHEGSVFRSIDRGMGKKISCCQGRKDNGQSQRRMHIERSVMVRAKLWFDVMFEVLL